MPLYEYKCHNCGVRYEVLQKFSDEPQTVHQVCGGGPVERLISTSALQFKGSGFYITDYAKGSSSPAPASAGGEPSPSKSDASSSKEGSSGKESTAPAPVAASSSSDTSKS